MISKEQWDVIEDALSIIHGRIELKYGDHKISLHRIALNECRLVIVVYIDDAYHPAWGFSSSKKYKPLVESIWRRRTKAYYTQKQQKELVKVWGGKRAAIKDFPRLFDKAVWFEPHFPKFSTLKSQFRKIESLELINTECIA
ncbi:hypothetical protein [Pseudoalteromonas luteoviolacea]|uniref:hypothetical protein n=1 Tax=Pseudoalteromonas luteoviolacea TaxID=43657 RepID=UPI001152AACB|nr:hypothetical protein [Pseudoalteromonas luteoviolacea]TQF71769.1 hypothetical protein FLM44_12100 [Pseudoalteromonas luteoviolacea]